MMEIMVTETNDALADTLLLSIRFENGAELCDQHRVLKCESTAEYLSYLARCHYRSRFEVVGCVRAEGHTSMYWH